MAASGGDIGGPLLRRRRSSDGIASFEAAGATLLFQGHPGEELSVTLPVAWTLVCPINHACAFRCSRARVCVLVYANAYLYACVCACACACVSMRVSCLAPLFSCQDEDALFVVAANGAGWTLSFPEVPEASNASANATTTTPLVSTSTTTTSMTTAGKDQRGAVICRVLAVFMAHKLRWHIKD